MQDGPLSAPKLAILVHAKFKSGTEQAASHFISGRAVVLIVLYRWMGGYCTSGQASGSRANRHGSGETADRPTAATLPSATLPIQRTFTPRSGGDPSAHAIERRPCGLPRTQRGLVKSLKHRAGVRMNQEHAQKSSPYIRGNQFVGHYRHHHVDSQGAAARLTLYYFRRAVQPTEIVESSGTSRTPTNTYHHSHFDQSTSLPTTPEG